MTDQKQIEKDIKGLKKDELKEIIYQLAGELMKASDALAQPQQEFNNEPSEYQGSKIGFLA